MPILPAGGVMPPNQTRLGQFQQRKNSGGIMPPGTGSPVPGYQPPTTMPVAKPPPVTDASPAIGDMQPLSGFTGNSAYLDKIAVNNSAPRNVDAYQTPGIMPPNDSGGRMSIAIPGGMPPRNTGIVPPGMGPSLGDALANYRPGQSGGVPMVTQPNLPSYQPRDPTQAPVVAAPNYQPGNAQTQAPSIPAPNYAAGSVGAPSVGGAQASANMFDMASFRPFADAVTNEAKRALDPRFQEEEAAFRQRMVNQGIPEGTPAYDTAFANFSRSKNDAYNSAQNQALAQALGAQNQMFGQSFQNAGLRQQADLANASNALQAAGLSQADRQFGANLNQQYGLANAANALQALGLNQADRQFGAGLGMQGALANQQSALQTLGLNQADRQFGANFGLQGAQLRQQGQLANQAAWLQKFGLDQNQNQFTRNLGQRESEFGRSFGEGQRQFDQNFGFQGQRADMSDLMALLGYGQQTTAANNAALTADQQRAGALFGLIPGLAPTQLDVMGPANSLMNQQNINNQAAASSQNGMMGAIGQLGAAGIMLSDRRLKTDIQRVGTLDNGLPVYVYRYKAGGPAMLGLMADEVEGVRPDAVATLPDGMQAVNYTEAVK